MSSPLLKSLDWLCHHAYAPGKTLARPVELLVLFAALAEMDNANVERASGKVERASVGEMASRGQQAENRRRAHFKSDNRVAT